MRQEQRASVRPLTFHAGEFKRWAPRPSVPLFRRERPSPHYSRQNNRDPPSPERPIGSSPDGRGSLLATAAEERGPAPTDSNGQLQAQQPPLTVGDGGRHQAGCPRHGFGLPRPLPPTPAVSPAPCGYGGPAPGRPPGPGQAAPQRTASGGGGEGRGGCRPRCASAGPVGLVPPAEPNACPGSGAPQPGHGSPQPGDR